MSGLIQFKLQWVKSGEVQGLERLRGVWGRSVEEVGRAMEE